MALLIFTSFLTSFANNYKVFALLRFFVGVFQGGTVLVSFVLGQELLGSSVWTITGNDCVDHLLSTFPVEDVVMKMPDQSADSSKACSKPTAFT